MPVKFLRLPLRAFCRVPSLSRCSATPGERQTQPAQSLGLPVYNGQHYEHGVPTEPFVPDFGLLVSR